MTWNLSTGIGTIMLDQIEYDKTEKEKRDAFKSSPFVGCFVMTALLPEV